MMREGVVLGHFISVDGIQVDPSKIRVIENIPTLGTQKEVRSFLGHAGYYRRFIEKFSKLASPLFTLLMKDVQFIWNDACQTTFTEIKKRLYTTPILRWGPTGLYLSTFLQRPLTFPWKQCWGSKMVKHDMQFTTSVKTWLLLNSITLLQRKNFQPLSTPLTNLGITSLDIPPFYTLTTQPSSI